MQVLVLGGTGFLSRGVAARLQEEGHAVTLFTRGIRPVPPGFDHVAGDRDDEQAFLDAVAGRPFDAVVDCICYTPEQARLAVRAWCGQVKHYVFISTDFVYPRRRSLPTDEECPVDAAGRYGRRKAACEALLLDAWREEGFPVTVLRPPHVLGAGGHLGTGSLRGRDPALLQRLEKGGPIFLLDGGALLIQPVNPRDVGGATSAVLAHPEATWGGVYNTAGPDRLTTRDYYDLVAATVGVPSPNYRSFPAELYAELLPEQAPFAAHRIYCMDRIRADTGFQPEVSAAHAVFETVDWLQAEEAARPYAPDELETALAALEDALESEIRRLFS